MREGGKEEAGGGGTDGFSPVTHTHAHTHTPKMKGRETLEKVIKESDPVGETHNYGRLVLAAHFLMISQQEYKPDRGLVCVF